MFDHIYHLVNSPSAFLRGRRSFNTGRSSSIQILGVSHHSRQRHKKHITIWCLQSTTEIIFSTDNKTVWMLSLFTWGTAGLWCCWLLLSFFPSLSVSLLALSAVKPLPWWWSCSVDILYLQFIIVRINKAPQKLFIPPRRTTVTPQSKMHPIKGPHLRVKIV